MHALVSPGIVLKGEFFNRTLEIVVGNELLNGWVGDIMNS